MSALASLIWRDVARSYSGGGVILPVIFFLLVATLYPFAIGPDGPLLARTGGGVLWIAALLAALLPVERLLSSDVEGGVLDQLTIRGTSTEAIAAAKILAHWLGFGPPLMLAAIPAAALMQIDRPTLVSLELGLAIGTPALAALAVLIAAITASLKGGSALAGLLLLPLAIPVLIFGAGTLSGAGGGLKLLAATSLFILALAPFASGAALRAGRT